MVIGFDGSRAFQEGRTGTENYSYQLLKALAKIDKANRYIVYLRPLDTQGQALQDWPQNFQFSILDFQFFWTQIDLAFQTFKDKLDILFVPAHTLPVIRRPGLKTVVTVHDLGSEYLPQMHQLKQRFYLGFMQKFQLIGASSIIAVSKATKEDLIKRVGIRPEKITVIYEGYDKCLFKPVEGDVLVNTLIHYNLKPKTYYLFVGTIQPRKNLERLIKAFSIIIARLSRKAPLARPGRSLRTRFALDNLSGNSNNVRSTSSVALTDLRLAPTLVVAGSKGWLSDAIYNLPKKLGIEDKVKFLGYVPEKDLPALYSGAIAFTFPSLFEGFGLPILEAQACGCPVLTSNISSMPEVAGKGAIYVDPYNTSDIVKGMRKINNQETRNKLIKKGFENIKRFSWDKCAEETLKVLENT